MMKKNEVGEIGGIFNARVELGIEKTTETVDSRISESFKSGREYLDRDGVAIIASVRTEPKSKQKMSKAELLKPNDASFFLPPIVKKSSISKKEVDVKKARELFIQPWAGTDTLALKGELYERSQIHFDWKPGTGDMLAVLDLYESEEKLVIPDSCYDIKPPKTVSAWREFFKHGEELPEFFVPNPHCGSMQNTLKGKPSWGAGSCYFRRFAVIEFDDMPVDDQQRLWLSLIDYGIHPATLIFSGGKSIHAWLPVETDQDVATIFKLLTPLGADTSAKNVGRLNRTPGAIRSENGIRQELLFLRVTKMTIADKLARLYQKNGLIIEPVGEKDETQGTILASDREIWEMTFG